MSPEAGVQEEDRLAQVGCPLQAVPLLGRSPGGLSPLCEKPELGDRACRQHPAPVSCQNRSVPGPCRCAYRHLHSLLIPTLLSPSSSTQPWCVANDPTCGKLQSQAGTLAGRGGKARPRVRPSRGGHEEAALNQRELGGMVIRQSC